MATTEHNGLLTYKDEAGNLRVLYPITKAELVDGLDEYLNEFSGKAQHIHAVLPAENWAEDYAAHELYCDIEIAGHDNTTDRVKVLEPDGMTGEEFEALRLASITRAAWQSGTVLRLYARGALPKTDLPVLLALRACQPEGEATSNVLESSVFIGAYDETNVSYEQLVNYTMLYDAGNDCAEVHGGLSADGYSVPGCTTSAGTKNAANLFLKAGAAGKAQLLGTANLVPFTGHVSLYCNGAASGSYSSANVEVVISTSKSLPATTPRIYYDKSAKGIKSLELSSYQADYYVACLSRNDAGRQGYVYNLFLTKPDDIATLCEKAGLSTPASVDSLLADSAALTAILSNKTSVIFMTRQCTGEFMVSAVQNETFLAALDASQYKTMVQANEHWAKFLAMMA